MITPAINLKMIGKGASLDCDSLIIDLEDSIAPNKKTEARNVMRTALTELTFSGKEVGVRINGLESPWFLDDLLALEGLPIDTVVLPKVQDSAQVHVYAAMLQQLELRGGTRGITLQMLIESARGLENITEIARASARCDALIFGAGDYIADSGVAATRRGLSYARSRIAAAACAAGVQAIDHVHPNFNDTATLLAEAAEAREIGYSGKWVIHPSQISAVNAAFSPSEQEIAFARCTIEAYERSLANGVGALAVDGSLVDEATLKIARRCQIAAQKLGSWTSGNA